MNISHEKAVKKAQRQRELTDRQQRFIQEYPIDLNAYQAALRAGYSKAQAQKARSCFFAHPLIKAGINEALEKRRERVEVTQDRIVQELANIAFSDMRDLAEWTDDTLTLKSSVMLTPQQSSLVKEISTASTATTSKTKIKRHDKIKALELLMRHMGMFNDKLSLQGGVDISLLEQARERAKNMYETSLINTNT